MPKRTVKPDWNPPPHSAFETAFQKAVDRGIMSENQYRYIARILCSNQPCDMLVFGGGYDAQLWYHCVQGRIAYVEDERKYLSLLPANGVYFKFESKVGFWTRPPPPPDLINHLWDYIIVDGPRGSKAKFPGRQIPIAWAAQLARKTLFVHDYNRTWERTPCDKYLGIPDVVLEADGRADRKLAVYNCRQTPPL